MINCRLLGPLQLTAVPHAAPVRVQGSKNVALLVYLAGAPSKARSRDHLIGLLWGDKPDKDARHSLREALRVLRRSLGDETVQTQGDEIRLDGQTFRTDTQQFEQFEAAQDWHNAAALVAGDFADGLVVRESSAFEDWLAVERVQWRRRSVMAMVQSADLSLAAGLTSRAASVALRAHSLDPGSETAVRAAMKCLALAGDRTVALERYTAYLRQLEGIGAEPNREIQQLAERVQRERAWHLPPSVPKAGERGAESRRAPLVGRHHELERIVFTWNETRTRRRAAVIVLEGDQGFGKTRLSEELASRARLDGSVVATFRAVEADADVAGTTILALARGGLLEGSGLAGAAPNALNTFAQHITEWADRFDHKDAGTQPLGAALIEVTRALAEEQPVLIVIDDAQWCDSPSLLDLIALTRDLAKLPVLICFGIVPAPRPELDELRSRLRRDLPGTTIRLKRLDRDALSQLAHWAMPTYNKEQIERLTRRLATDSAGLPLLAIELLHAVAIGLDLSESTEAWPAPARTLTQTLPSDLPDAIVAAIRLGFRRLSTNAQTVLASLSVLDERATTEQTRKATELDGDALETALDELEWQRWIAADGDGYTFVARIIRQVIARDMLTEGQRVRIRKRVGTAEV